MAQAILDAMLHSKGYGLAAEFPAKLVLTGNLVSYTVVFPRQTILAGKLNRIRT